MNYVSTRGSAPALDFEAVLLAGLARDGGLYVPSDWPRVEAEEIAQFDGLAYDEVVYRVVRRFIDDAAIGDRELRSIVQNAYAGFTHPAIAPLRQVDRNTWMLELFHGPTLAFKDFALQLLGGLFEHVLSRRGERITIIGATSGDTGSAAIEACRGRENIEIFMLHPHGRVSEVQRRQMTTVDAENVHNIAVEGTFDDCQDIVKGMFADTALRDSLNLSAVNSINWARVMAQTAYYFAAGAALGAPGRSLSFVVPTGNFGNVYAGYAARQMGLPVDRLIVASNRNDILFRFLSEGDMSISDVVPSLSPSMDIQVSSNFERLLFDLLQRDGALVGEAISQFRASGRLPEGARLREAARDLFDGYRVDDEETLSIIADVHARAGLLIDPHTAVALGAARKAPDEGVKRIVLSTAHPAKFPDAVEKATGIRPALPEHMADLFDRPERVERLPNELAAVGRYVRDVATARQAA